MALVPSVAVRERLPAWRGLVPLHPRRPWRPGAAGRHDRGERHRRGRSDRDRPLATGAGRRPFHPARRCRRPSRGPAAGLSRPCRRPLAALLSAVSRVRLADASAVSRVRLADASTAGGSAWRHPSAAFRRRGETLLLRRSVGNVSFVQEPGSCYRRKPVRRSGAEEPGASGTEALPPVRAGERLTRCESRSSGCASRLSARNHNPARSPTGDLSHARTAAVRDGNVAANVPS